MTSGPVLGAAALVAVAVVIAATGVAPALTSPARSPRPSATGRRLGAIRRLSGSRRGAAPPDDVAVAAWCDRVARSMRAGSSLTAAVVAAGDRPGAPFADVAHAVSRGRPVGAVFADAAGDPSTPIGLAAPVVAVCAELGGPATPALERVAATLLSRAAERDERRTASAQAELSARVLTVLPVGVLGVLVLAEPTIRGVLATPAGAGCLAAGVTCDVLGWCWMRRMIGASS